MCRQRVECGLDLGIGAPSLADPIGGYQLAQETEHWHIIEFSADAARQAEAEAKVAKATAEVEQIKVETQAKIAETQIKIRDANNAPTQSARNGGNGQQPVVVATEPGSVQIGMRPEEFAMLADGLSRKSEGLAQGLAVLGQSIEAGNLQMAQAVAVQMSHAIELQGAQMAQAVEQLGEGGKAMIDAKSKRRRYSCPLRRAGSTLLQSWQFGCRGLSRPPDNS